MNKVYKTAANTDKFLIHGRTLVRDDLLGVHWTASGLEMIFCGNAIDFSFGALNAEQAVYLRVTADGKSAVHSLSTGREHIVVGDMEDGIHRLSIIRLNADAADVLWFDEIMLEGEKPALLPPPCELARKIEFYGDSITCGYGNLGYDGPGYHAHRSDGMKTYAYYTASALGAEGRYNGFSGQGIAHEWGGNVGTTFGVFFDRALKNLEDKYDMSLWTPDVVVINAGTNDCHGGTAPDEFYEGGKALLENMRAKYPNAVIIWLYGMMGNPFHDSITRIMSELTKTDDKIYYLPTRSIGQGEQGGNGHPGLKCHERVASELTAFIKNIMKW